MLMFEKEIESVRNNKKKKNENKYRTRIRQKYLQHI